MLRRLLPLLALLWAVPASAQDITSVDDGDWDDRTLLPLCEDEEGAVQALMAAARWRESDQRRLRVAIKRARPVRVAPADQRGQTAAA